MNNKYGICPGCKTELIPIWFMEEEFRIESGIMYKTGRKRRAVDYLECPSCLKKECVDDSFDGNWYYEK